MQKRKINAEKLWFLLDAFNFYLNYLNTAKGMTITNYIYMAKVELPNLMTGVLGFDCVPCEGDAKVNFGCNTEFLVHSKCRNAYSTDSIVDNTSIYPSYITQNICKLKHVIILFILTAYLASIDCMQIWDESTGGRVFISLHILKNVLREESTAPPFHVTNY